MLVYWAIFAIPALFALSEDGRSNERSAGPFLVLLVILWTILAFRETGGDWPTYLLMFNIISHSSIERTLELGEPGYALLNYASSRLDLGLYGVNSVCAAIFLLGLHRFAARETRPLLMLAVATPYLVTVVAMGYTRQGTAIGWILLGLSWLREGRAIRFLAMVAAAAAFHRSAIVLAPLAYFAAPKLNEKRGRLLRLATAAGAVAAFYLSASDDLEQLWSFYVTSDHYQSSGALLRSLMGGAAAAVVIVFRRQWQERWNDAGIWMTFAIASLIAVPLSTIASTAVDRVGLYLIPLQLVAFARFPDLPRGHTSPAALLTIGVLGAYTLTLVTWLHFGQFASVLWLPYRSLIYGEIP